MTVMRSALLILSLFPATALGQAAEGEGDAKVSNDQPGRPLQMPPASTEVKEAIEESAEARTPEERERALKAAEEALEDVERADADEGPKKQ